LRTALDEVLKALPAAEYPLVSDLTGGYDSRLLLSALLESKRPFTTTVTGQMNDPDVRVAADIAQTFGLQLEIIQPLRELPTDLLMRALGMTDGECDMFEYANILHTQSSHVAGHAASLNGSFGELARGYWWELLWPKLGRMLPLDATMLSRRRFAAIPYEAGLFSGAADFKLDKHMGDVVERTLRPIQHQPNTTQMDCAYYSMRMQRWQGRIASSTNRLWPSFSPVGFAQVLDPILAAKAATRFRSLLARKVIAHTAKLGSIPLEHGYPPCPATPWNIWRFAPLLGHYGGKVVEKLMQRLPRRGPQTVAPTQGERPEFAALFAHTEIKAYLAQPRLLESGLFKETELKAFLSTSRQLNSHRNLQWRRLVTLEFMLRRMASD
jgi:asparagine synthase (glutamine-hydrolysing)